MIDLKSAEASIRQAMNFCFIAMKPEWNCSAAKLDLSFYSFDNYKVYFRLTSSGDFVVSIMLLKIHILGDRAPALMKKFNSLEPHARLKVDRTNTYITLSYTGSIQNAREAADPLTEFDNALNGIFTDRSPSAPYFRELLRLARR